MQIVLDKRERELIKFCTEYLEKTPLDNIHIILDELAIGDAIIKDDNKTHIIIERKTFKDLFASIKDGRYEEQSHRLINASGVQQHSILYILEGMFSQVLEKEKNLVYSTMASLYYFKGFATIRTSGINETGELIINFARKLHKDLNNGRSPYYNILNENGEPTQQEQPQTNYCNFVKKVKKDNITPENIGEIMLSQIPGISSVTAIAVMKKFSSIKNLIEELNTNSDCLNGITTESNGKLRKISKTSIESIRNYLCGITGSIV